MTWKIIAVGKPKMICVQAGVEEYLKRLQAHAKINPVYLKEGQSLLKPSEGTLRIVLDERGTQWTSLELSRQLSEWEQRSIKSVSVLIGGADGHDDSTRRSAALLWSLSKLTLPHEIALLIVVEQIYRAYSIKAGLPYHRGAN